MILADSGPPPSVYTSPMSTLDFNSATLRMARLYYDRYHATHKDLLDWSNLQGRTALHLAAVKGNEELVRVCAHFVPWVDYSDNSFIRCSVTSMQISTCLMFREILLCISEPNLL